jgi:hypothetical protein
MPIVSDALAVAVRLGSVSVVDTVMPAKASAVAVRLGSASVADTVMDATIGMPA